MKIKNIISLGIAVFCIFLIIFYFNSSDSINEEYDLSQTHKFTIYIDKTNITDIGFTQELKYHKIQFSFQGIENFKLELKNFGICDTSKEQAENPFLCDNLSIESIRANLSCAKNPNVENFIFCNITPIENNGYVTILDTTILPPAGNYRFDIFSSNPTSFDFSGYFDLGNKSECLNPCYSINSPFIQVKNEAGSKISLDSISADYTERKRVEYVDFDIYTRDAIISKKNEDNEKLNTNILLPVKLGLVFIALEKLFEILSNLLETRLQKKKRSSEKSK